MKNPSNIRQRYTGITIWEVLIILAITIALALIVWRKLQESRSVAARISCVSNLKQVGMSFLIYGNDHDEQYPQFVSAAEGGVKEDAHRGEIFRIFQVMSNELAFPKTVVCPEDERAVSISFATLSNTNISYFVGLEANKTKPNMLLSGDRDMEVKGKLLSGIVRLQNGTNVQWSRSLHPRGGNLGLGDGSVQQATTATLVTQLQESGDTNNLVLFPQ